MDNLTHSLVGLMMARVGIDRKIAQAAPIMILAANAPDVDAIFIYNPEKYLEYHRGYCHALACAPAMALLPLALVWLFTRQRFTLAAYLFSILGVLSHLLLDWTNIYGIRMLLPFSSRWLHLDTTDVVDPWIWAILLLAVAAPAFVRMVSSEIASHEMKSGPKFGWACFALLALFGYDGGRLVLHDRAIQVMGARLYNGSIARVSALPGPRFNPMRWKGVAEGTASAGADAPMLPFVVIVPVDLTGTFDPTAGRTYYPALPSAAPNAAIIAARATHAFQVFANFDQLPFWKVTKLDPEAPDDSARGIEQSGARLLVEPPARKRVELIDLRFGTPDHPGFVATAIVDASGVVERARVAFGGVPGRGD